MNMLAWATHNHQKFRSRTRLVETQENPSRFSSMQALLTDQEASLLKKLPSFVANMSFRPGLKEPRHDLLLPRANAAPWCQGLYGQGLLNVAPPELALPKLALNLALPSLESVQALLVVKIGLRQLNRKKSWTEPFRCLEHS